MLIGQHDQWLVEAIHQQQIVLNNEYRLLPECLYSVLGPFPPEVSTRVIPPGPPP